MKTGVWAAVASALLGVWSIAAPALLGHAGAARTSLHVVGPLVATFAAIAVSQATRVTRYLNVPLGVWLIASPVLFGSELLLALHDVTLGLAIVVLSLVPRRDRFRQGGGWAALSRRASS